MSERRFRSPHTVFPHTQFLSNGRYVVGVTNSGRRQQLLPGRHGDPRAPRSDLRLRQPVHLPARRAQRRGLVADLPPDARREPEDYSVTFLPDKATFRRRDHDIGTQLDIAVSTEDDVEVRRVTVRNHGARIREIDVTSYAEIVLTTASDDLAHPAFGKLFIETEYLPAAAALLCHRRPRDPTRSRPSGPCTSWRLEGRPQGPVEWETDRARFIGRGRDTDRPAALDGHPLSGTTGIVLDPILSLRQRIRLPPGATCGCVSRPAWRGSRAG